MSNVPSVPEIITVNSETLQTQIRDLLPSQRGFGSELQASNVITPSIDLTSAAEGSTLPLDLQTALAFGSQTVFNLNNASLVLANSPGFYRVIAVSGVGSGSNSITMDDGVTTKAVVQHDAPAVTANFDYIFWLDSGITLTAVSGSASNRLGGSVRQVADSEGVLTNPSGYPL